MKIQPLFSPFLTASQGSGTSAGQSDESPNIQARLRNLMVPKAPSSPARALDARERCLTPRGIPRNSNTPTSPAIFRNTLSAENLREKLQNLRVAETDCGITTSHIRDIENIAKNNDTFIFVRPTELQSTYLIKKGFATKSNDIKSKSSNWGPMAGFVPCNPGFDKNHETLPQDCHDASENMAAKKVQLSLTNEIVKDYVNKKYMTKIEFKKLGIVVTNLTDVTTGKNHAFYQAKPKDAGHAKLLNFCLVENNAHHEVFWLKVDGEKRASLQELNVFGYAHNDVVKPVTGDYDLWMIAPHEKKSGSHVVTDLHNNQHGETAASSFSMNLMQQMNEACQPDGPPVFHHGAENENIHFTQKLDAKVAMFTPIGTSRIVRMTDMPKILGDLNTARYLTFWNKQWSSADPKFMGKVHEKKSITQLETLKRDYLQARSELKTAAQADSDITLERTHSFDLISAKAIYDKSTSFNDLSRAVKSMIVAREEPGGNYARMYRFFDDLMTYVKSTDMTLNVLKESDFPKKLETVSAAVSKARLQWLKIKADAAHKKGETNMVKMLAFDVENRSLYREVFGHDFIDRDGAS